MPVMLLLTQRIPYPPNKGEKIRSLQILRHFSKDFDVHLGCLVDAPSDWQYVQTVKEMCAGAYFARINPKIRLLTCQTGWLNGTPLSFSYFAHSGLAAWVNDVMTRLKPDVVVVSSSNMAPYVTSHPNPPPCRLIDFVDVDSAKWREYAEKGGVIMGYVHAREARLVLAQDRISAQWATANTLVSEAEAAIFRDLAPESARKIHAVANGVDSAYFSPDHSFAPLYDTSLPSFVFTGAMDYPPNIDAAVWFATDILPVIRNRIGNAQFYIVGMNPVSEIKRLAQQDGVHVTGRVDDVRPYVAHALAAVAPLRIARGIQNKVLEAMAMAKPVIVTSPALEGIDAALPGHDVLLADSAADIANLARQLAAGEIAGAPLGHAARKCVVDHYSWPARLAKFDELLGNA